MTENEKRELGEKQVTLDGKPAKVIGDKCKFATVATIPSGPAYQWSWQAVKRVIANGGKFKS